MTTVPVRAYAFAATFRLSDLAQCFPGADVTVDRDRLVAVYHGADQDSVNMAFAFDFGALVLMGLDNAERNQVLRAVSAKLEPEPHAPLTEEFLVEVRPGSAVQVHFDRLVIPDTALAKLDLISLLLAQSATLDYYDEDVQEILKHGDMISQSLQSGGRLPGNMRDLLKFIGTCIAAKNDVIASLALFDKPDSVWEDAELDRLYRALRLELEIDDRFRAMEAKLRMIQENLVLLVDLSRHRSTYRLEWTVVLLIAFEIALSIWQIIVRGAH